MSRDCRNDLRCEWLGTRIENQTLLSGLLFFNKKNKHEPFNSIQPGTYLVEECMCPGGLAKCMEAFEVGIEDRAITGSGEGDVHLNTSAPLINATFHLKMDE